MNSPTRLGRYELVRPLGRGAMGIVYEGRDPNLDRRVAIKTIRMDSLGSAEAAEYDIRFRTEARSAARLQHPNIVSVYDSDRDGDTAFLVMEFVQGNDLKYHLDGGRRYNLEESLRMLDDLLAALDYSHRQGIVHRDIKPANLLLEASGRLKLADFGVARVQDGTDATRTVGGMVGTLKYMSPEQVQGRRADPRSDLFSVGVVLYQLLTDRRPFDGTTEYEIIASIVAEDPVPPSTFNSGLPAAMDRVLERALAKDREKRFQSAAEMALALRAAVQPGDDTTVLPPQAPRAPRAEGGASTLPSAWPASLPPPSISGTGSVVTQELELVYWKDVKDSGDPEELDMFLSKFPSGVYADLARKRLRALSMGRVTVRDGMTQPGTSMPGNYDPTLRASELPGESTSLAQTRVHAPPELVAKPVEAAAPEGTMTRVLPPPGGNPPEGAPGTVPAGPVAPPTPEPSTAPAVPSVASDVPAPATAVKGSAASTAPESGTKKEGASSSSRSAGKSASRRADAVLVPAPPPAPGGGGRRGWMVVAGLAAVGAVAAVLWGRSAAPVSPAAVSALSAASAASAPATAEAPGALSSASAPSGTALTAASAPVSAALTAVSMPASAASAPRIASSAARAASARLAAASAAARGAVSAPPPPRVETVPAKAPESVPAPVVPASRPTRATESTPAAPVSRNPEDACKDKVLLGRESCLREQCALPAFRDHAVCKQRREWESWREEERNRLLRGN